MEVKLPSGKIDLNPRGGFEVVPGQAMAIELDLDLDKSIQMKEAGNSGKCIFRPVIFVAIYDQPAFIPPCPRIISGTINTLIYDDDRIVQVDAYATILDENGSLVGIEGIEVGDTITSHGIESCEEGVTQISFVISVQEDPVVVPI